MAADIKDRAALELTLRFMDERIKPRRCDSDGVSGCWRCQSMYLAKRMRELLAERDAHGVAPSQAPSSEDVLAEVVKWALAGHITEAGVTVEACKAIRAVASGVPEPLKGGA